MSVAWSGEAAEALPPLTARELVRLALRSGGLLLVTALSLALLLASRAFGGTRRADARRRLAASTLRLWARAALALAGLRLRQVGQPTARPGALVANHAGWLDIVVLMRFAPLIFVSKAEVRHWPLVGAIGQAIGTAFIERRPAEARGQAALLRARLLRGERIAFFPEGTSTDGRRVLRFKSALFEALLAADPPGAVPGRDPGAALSVQPVSIVYGAPGALPATVYAWWGETGFAASLRDVLARSRGGTVELVFHPPLRVADYPDRKALARAAEAAVRAGLEERLWRSGAGGCAGAT